LYWGHIGAIDGWFPRTEMPRGVSNQADYFSGHYAAYGLNIQAMCDPDLVFMYVAVAGPVRINDSRAFSCCSGLIDWFETLCSFAAALPELPTPISLHRGWRRRDWRLRPND